MPEIVQAWEETVSRCVALPWRETPAPARERAALVLADTVGAMRAGARHPAYVRVERALVDADGARPSGARALAAEDRVAPETAAFLYGTAGTWLELDEAAAAGVHAAVHVASALLAVAQTDRLAGARLLDGFLAGYEVAAALSEQLPVRYPVHPHAGLAAVGAAAGVAVALGSDPLAACAIAATLPIVPTWDACFEGATARHAYAGAAASLAVRANVLAGGGMTGATGAAETLFGAIVGDDAGPPPPPSVTAPRLLASTIKHHAACLTCHTAIEAALHLGPVDPEAVAAIDVWTVPAVADKVARAAAPNELSTRFSLPYAVAAALVHGRSDPSAFAWDPTVADVAGRVSVDVDRALPDEGHAMPARVRLRLRDGSAREHEVLHVQGGPGRAATEAAVRAKFTAHGGEPELLARLLAIDAREDCGDLLDIAADAPDASTTDEDALTEAVRRASANARRGQRPFAALVVRDGRVLGVGANTALRDGDPSAHAEVNAIRDACARLGCEDLTGATVVTSCEPCPVCQALSTLVGIRRIVYAATKEQAATIGFPLHGPAAREQAALRAAGAIAVEHRAVAGAAEPFELWARHAGLA